jgi:thiamine-phosphate pyrophosphorylase
MILFTNSQQVPNETEIINALFEEGLEVLHLRKPGFDQVQMREFISKIDLRFHVRIMIHSHYELLDSYNLKGLHFTEKTKHLLQDYNDVQCAKSMAVHELDELKSVHPTVGYILLSPMFPSVSKQGYSKQWDVEELKLELAKNHSFSTVALGGITLKNVKTVKELGFQNFALLGSIWEPVKAGCSKEQAIDILKKFKHEE